MPSRLRLAAAAAALATATLSHSQRAPACGLASRLGHIVRIDAEEALIVWDAQRQTEHFVRRADFTTAAPDFGFLVPTPSVPEIAEADDGVFTRLAAIYSAPVRVPRGRGRPGLRRSSGAARAAVQVVAVTRVAGLEATVLRANDASALNEWLGRHGYASRPALTAWLAPYVRQGWVVTAFRYAPGADQQQFGSRAVRMSFRTPRPFYPYSEPADSPPGRDRRLRVTLVARERLEGVLSGGAWATGRTGFAGRVPNLAAVLRGAAPSPSFGRQAWVTTLEESPSNRGSDDLYFRRARVQRPVPPSIVSAVWVREQSAADLL